MFQLIAFLGFVVIFIIPVFLANTRQARSKILSMLLGLYVAGLSAFAALMVLYGALFQGVVAFSSSRNHGVVLHYSEAPLLFIILLPVAVALPGCFIVLGWRIYRNARLNKPGF